jgi:uncharacterized protein
MENALKDRKIVDICKRHGINYLALFGSRARGDFRPDSDVDLLVRFNKVVSLFDLIRAENALKDSLNMPVDLVMDNSLRPVFRPYVEKDLKVIYAEK